MTIAIELSLIVLLVLSIGYGFVLNRRIVALRRDQKDLERLAVSFSKATQRAETGVAQLKAATQGSVAALRDAIGKAETIRGDLEFLIDRGTGTADKLERSIRGAERSVRTTPADDGPVRVGEGILEGRRPAASGRSEEERQLLKALRAVR